MHSSPTTTTLLLALSSTLLLPNPVNAHGFVQEVRNNGQSYPGSQPWWVGSPWPHVASAGWPQANQDWGYVEPALYNTSAIACGKQATPGQAIIPVAAGSQVELLWTAWPDSHHGPVLTYLAKCPGDCLHADKKSLEFFKIDAKGMTSSGVIPG